MTNLRKCPSFENILAHFHFEQIAFAINHEDFFPKASGGSLNRFSLEGQVSND